MKTCLTLLFAFGALILTTPASFAATIIVPEQYPSIPSAIEAAQKGDIVEVGKGVYEGPVEMKDGVELRGAGADKVVLRPGPDGGPALLIEYCTMGKVSGFTVEGAPNNQETPATRKEITKAKARPEAALVLCRDSDADIGDCVVRHAEDAGIHITGRGKVAVHGCTVADNGMYGIYVETPNAVASVTNNHCDNNRLDGIRFYYGSSGVVESNSCSENKFNGILVDFNTPDVVVRGNECTRNAMYGILLSADGGDLVENNTCSENEWFGIWLASDGKRPPLLRNNRCVHNGWGGIVFGQDLRSGSEGNDFLDNYGIHPTEVCFLLAHERFGDLEGLAKLCRTEKKQSDKHGSWLLAFFYDAFSLQWGKFSLESPKPLLDILEKWRKAYPESATPLIALAEVHTKLAWKARGGGWAYTVTEEGWRGFYEHLNKAWSILIEAERFEAEDPELYACATTAAMGLGRDTISLSDLFLGKLSGTKPATAMDRILEKGQSIDAFYLPLYQARAVSLLPRWGGVPGELEAFAEAVAEKTKDRVGDGYYALLAATTYNYVGRDEYIQRHRFSWSRVRQGYEDLLKAQPGVKERLHWCAVLACAHQDKQVAQDLFQRIGDEAHIREEDLLVWKSRLRFRIYRAWAMDDGPYPVELSPLYDAICSDDIDRMKTLLGSGESPNVIDELGVTPLVAAMSRKNTANALVDLFLEWGADPNFPTGEGYYPLPAAFYYQNMDIVRSLLKHGADPNKVGLGRPPALHRAVAQNQAEIVALLFERGADPNILDDADQSTPLMVAAREGKTDLAALLLERGADPNAACEDGWSVLEEAVGNGNADLVRLLIDAGADVNHQETDGWTALHEAARQETADILEMLLAVPGCRLDLKTRAHDTLLHAAASKGRINCVALLLERGIEVNPVNRRGETPFARAKAGGFTDVMALLAQHGGAEAP